MRGNLTPKMFIPKKTIYEASFFFFKKLLAKTKIDLFTAKFRSMCTWFKICHWFDKKCLQQYWNCIQYWRININKTSDVTNIRMSEDTLIREVQGMGKSMFITAEKIQWTLFIQDCHTLSTQRNKTAPVRKAWSECCQEGDPDTASSFFGGTKKNFTSAIRVTPSFLDHC